MKIFTDYEKERLVELAENLFFHGFENAIRPFENEDIYDTTENWVSSHYYFLRSMNCSVVHGMTRIVVICEDLPWVLKFNFQDKNMRQDYNLLEATNYKRACEEGVEEFFAATYYLGVVDGIMTYAQEKVEANEDVVSSSFFEYTLETYFSDRVVENEEDEDKLNDDAWDEANCLDNEDRIYAMIENFKDARRVWEFTDKYDINDLHSGNWGYRGKQPVLIDYSGY